jgi:hypothetical protein
LGHKNSGKNNNSNYQNKKSQIIDKTQLLFIQFKTYYLSQKWKLKAIESKFSRRITMSATSYATTESICMRFQYAARSATNYAANSIFRSYYSIGYYSLSAKFTSCKFSCNFSCKFRHQQMIAEIVHVQLTMTATKIQIM